MEADKYIKNIYSDIGEWNVEFGWVMDGKRQGSFL